MNTKPVNLWRLGLIIAMFLGVFILFMTITWTGYGRVEAIYKTNESIGNARKALKRTILDLQSMHDRRSWDNQRKTSLYIQQRLAELNLQPSVHIYSHKSEAWENVSVTFSGCIHTDRKIVIVAHYDSTTAMRNEKAPGADDNASGVAVLIDLADILRYRKNINTVQLVFFSNEEHGQHGSRAFVRDLKKENTEVIGAINIDIVGYNAPGALFSTEPFSALNAPGPIRLKAKMLAKMIYNWGTFISNWAKTLKVLAREEDQYLLPNGSEKGNNTGGENVKWIVGPFC